MGDIRLYKCECGYEEQLFAGVGRAGIYPNNIEGLFPEEAESIRTGISDNSMESFMMDNVPAKCSLCQRICAVPRIEYKLTNRAKLTSVKGQCVHCNNTDMEVIASWDFLKCPKCGKEMDYIQTGHWD